MMISAWGQIPEAAVAKAEMAYGKAVRDYFAKGVDMLRAPAYLAACLKAMSMDAGRSESILDNLDSSPLAMRGT